MNIREIRRRLIDFSGGEIRLIIFLCQIILAVIVGSRSLDIGTDTINYAMLFDSIENCQCIKGSKEIGFEWFTLMISLTGFGITFYFICISLVIFMLINLVTSKIIQLDGNECTLDGSVLRVLILAAFLVSPFFVSAHINAIRQGMAAFFVFYALLSVLNKNWKGLIITGLIAILIHSSSVIYLGLFPLLLLPFRLLLLLVAFLSVVYVSEFSGILLQWVSDTFDISLYDRVVNFRKEVNYRSGVRYDFLIFSWLGVFFALSGRYFLDKKERATTLKALVKVYLLLIIPFLCFGFANFSNRYAYTAWLFLSILIACTVYWTVFWKGMEKFSLPALIVFAPSIFLLMTLNGFAK